MFWLLDDRGYLKSNFNSNVFQIPVLNKIIADETLKTHIPAAFVITACEISTLPFTSLSTKLECGKTTGNTKGSACFCHLTILM
jgi:hypothetical protein